MAKSIEERRRIIRDAELDWRQVKDRGADPSAYAALIERRLKDAGATRREAATEAGRIVSR